MVPMAQLPGVGPEILSGLGAKVININVNPDGLNINHHCGSTHIEGLQVAVQQHNVRPWYC